MNKILLVVVALGTVISAVIIIQLLKPKPRVFFHGTNLNTKPNEIQSESAMRKGTTTTQGRLTPSPAPTSSNSVKSPTRPLIDSFGFSAGDLPGLGGKALIDRFDDINSIGAKWVRFDISWNSLQPNDPEVYNWSTFDRVIDEANKRGIKCVVILDNTPKWARIPGCTLNERCAPEDNNTFASFSQAVVNRYSKRGVKFWEIWNEPNHVGSWGQTPDVIAYIDLLKKTYTAIKQEDPNAIVISGGLAPTYSRDGNIAPADFLSAIYQEGAQNYFDAVGHHPYSYPAMPSYTGDWSGWTQMLDLRKIMVKNNDINKRIWITEYGAPTGGPGSMHEVNQLSFAHGSDYMSETAQKEMAQQAMTLYSQNTDWMGPFFWYSLKDSGTSKNTPENFFGLLRYDWSKKPAYDVFRNAILSNQ